MPNYDKPNRSKFFNGPLYDQMTEDLHLTGKAQRTVYGYLRAVRQLADHCRKAPDEISETELRRYFLFLKNKRKAAYGTLRVALSGIKFFYETTCPRPWKIFSMLRLKNEKTLPEVITRQQVRQIILAATTQRMRVFFWTVYSLGLRLNEALHLEIGDIDGQRKMVHVHRGKGAKDRYIPISQFTIEALRRYWLTHRHIHYVVPGGGVVLDAKGKPVQWKSTPTNFLVHHGTLIRVYKAKLADGLRAAGLYQPVPPEAWQKDFVVDIQPVNDGRSTVAYLAPYVHRVAVSDHRIKSVDATSVTYQYKPKKSLTLLTREVPGEEFVKSFAQHILPTRFRKVRYYGWMASNSKTKLEELRILVWMMLGWVYWLATAHVPQTPIKPFPKVCCQACGGEMVVIAIKHSPILPTLASHALAYLDSG